LSGFLLPVEKCFKQIYEDGYMLDEKDSLILNLCVVEGFKDQLLLQEATALYLVRPGQLSVATQIAMEKDALDQYAKNLTEEIDAISLREAHQQSI